MEKDICIIFDRDEKFANRLMDAINRKTRLPYRIYIFTNLKLFENFMLQNPPKLLIIQDEFFKAEYKFSKTGRTVILYEEYLIQAVEENVLKIFKYQSSEIIVKEIMAFCKDIYGAELEAAHIIGIYSPVTNAYKTTFSLALANAYENLSALYINLEEFCGLYELLPQNKNGNLSDILYYFKTDKKNLSEIMEKIICRIGNFNYIPPIRCADDIAYVATQEWMNLVNCIAQMGVYDVIILDIANIIKEQWKLINICNRILIPVKEDYISRKKISSFEMYLLELGKESICNRIEKIQIPYDETTVLNNEFINKVEWTKLGIYAKEVANG